MVFLENSVGFFIQFFPCVLMIFLPFPQEAFRFGKKWMFVCLTSAVMIVSILLPFVLYVNADGNTALTAILFMLSVILLTLAAYIFLVNETLIKKLLVFFVVIFYAALQYCTVNALEVLFFEFLHIPALRESWSAYSPQGVAMYAATAAVLMPFVTVFISRTLSEYIRSVETKSMRREFLTLISSTVAFIAVMMLVDFMYYYLDRKLYMLLLAMLAVLLLYQILIYRLIFRESVRRRHENENRRAMEIKQLQYEKIVGDMESTRRMRHDMRHHYTTLSDMLDRGKTDEMKEYLSKVTDMTVKHDNEIYCKNMTVNGLLQYYVGLARDAGISCEVMAECGEISIEPVDLTVLFGNAMENAINSCMKSGDNGWINIKIGVVRGSFAIEISNYCGNARVNCPFQTQDGFLPAEAFMSERAGGGYGLRSIAHTAKKYGGSAKFRFNDETKTFTTRIRLNMNTNL